MVMSDGGQEQSEAIARSDAIGVSDTPAFANVDEATTTEHVQPNRSDIAEAVAARLHKGNDTQGSGDDDELERARLRAAHTLKVRRLINEVSGAVSYERVFACLKLIHTLLDNIVRHADEDKYRSFRAAQPKIARDVLAVPHATDLLIVSGFRTRTTSFQQEWFVPDGATWPSNSVGMLRLAWTREAIAERMDEYEDNAERARLRALQEKEFQANRKARALAEAQEDRERVALRSRREKEARAAAVRTQQQKEEQDKNESTDKP